MSLVKQPVAVAGLFALLRLPAIPGCATNPRPDVNPAEREQVAPATDPAPLSHTAGLLRFGNALFGCREHSDPRWGDRDVLISREFSGVRRGLARERRGVARILRREWVPYA